MTLIEEGIDTLPTNVEVEAGDAHHIYARDPLDHVAYAVRRRPTFDISYERADEGWIVEDGPTGIFGVGDDIAGALMDFRRAARDHLDVLESRPALAPALRTQLEYLRDRLA